MYPIGKQFEVDLSKAQTDEKCIFKGKKYRISVLTERLVRLEYSESGKFVDAPSQLVKNRYLGFPEFQVKQDTKFLEITTKYFHLTYVKEAPFTGSKVDPMKNLKISLTTGTRDNDRDWYYGHPEVKNYGGNMMAKDISTSRRNNRGLYSIDGFASFNDSNSLLYASDGTLYNREKESADIYVFMYYKDFDKALLDYFHLTGMPALIPRYALGNWWSKNYTYTDKEVLALANNFERRKIPLSVILLDKDWHYRNIGEMKELKTGFTFNKDLFPNPQDTIYKLHEKNIRLGLRVDPTGGFYPHEQFYQQACQYLGIENSKIILFDPLNPKLMDVYFKLFLHPLEGLGVDFFWSDYQAEANPYKLSAYNRMMYQDAGRNPAKRSLHLSRNALMAGHLYPVLYAGSNEISWETLKDVAFSNLNAANIGVSWWSHNIGGNHGGVEESELYIRFVELGCFSPIFRIHGARGKYYKKEPWIWDIKTETIASDYMRFRHRLIPYLYTEAYKYYSEGKVLVEPFYHKNPWVYDDSSYKFQYFFGDSLLICPILTKKDPTMNRTIQRFFIPDGIWYEFKTGKKFLGNKKYVSFFTEEEYPVFARSGAIIPLSNKSDRNNIGLPTDLEVHIFPGVSNIYTLYEDDGLTSLYKEGFYLKTDFDYNYLQNNYTLIIRSTEGKSGIVPERRNYRIRFRNTKQADDLDAHFNDEKIPLTSYVEDNDFVVELQNVPTIGQLTINCKGRDIEIDAVRVMNEDINSILMDLQINTYLKEQIAEIMFDTENTISKKRIAIRKLKKKGLSREYMKLFLKLLEYIGEI